jgi:hypothetical protein
MARVSTLRLMATMGATDFYIVHGNFPTWQSLRRDGLL